MKRKIFLGVLLIIFTALTTKLSYDFLIEWSQDTGLFFIPVLCLSKLDPIFTTNILWKMPLSQFVYSIFHIFPLKYLNFIIFFIFFLYFLISIIIISQNSKYLSSKVLFFCLSILYIYIFKYSFDIEQIIYTLYLILFGYFFYIKEKENNLKNTISCSLVLGFSFLIKTNLIILPPFLAIYDFIKNKNLKTTLITAFLPYILLLPWIIFSYSISGEILIVEKNRANLNILTGLSAITHTAEGNYEKIKEIIQRYQPQNLFIELTKVVFLKVIIFLKTFNILFLILVIISYIKKIKLVNTYLMLIIILFLTHLPFSVEKRYLFPCGILMIIGISISISNENKKINYTISKMFFIISSIPIILISSIILTYSIYKPKKDYCKQFKSYNIVKAIENLYYIKRDKAIFLLKEYTKEKKYIYTEHIKEIISILDENIIQKPTYPSLIFNSDLLIFLKLISFKMLNEARIYIEKNWKDISSSYIRTPITKREQEINRELENYIKENFMTFPTFVIISSNIAEMTDLCKIANNIINKISKKHKFNCNFKQTATQTYIRGKCINKNYNFSLSKVIEEIVKLERQKKYDEALKIIENNINKTEFYKFYVEKANILYLQNKFEQAEKNYLKAIELCPCAPDAIYGIKSIYKKKKINYKPHPECSFLKF